MCVKYPSHLVFNQNHRISFPYTTHFVFAIIPEPQESHFLRNFLLAFAAQDGEGPLAVDPPDVTYIGTDFRSAVSDVRGRERILYVEAAGAGTAAEGNAGGQTDDNSFRAAYHRENLQKQYRADHTEKPDAELDGQEHELADVQSHWPETEEDFRRPFVVLRYRRREAGH